MSSITATLTAIAAAANLPARAYSALAATHQAHDATAHVAAALTWLDDRRSDMTRRPVGTADAFGDQWTMTDLADGLRDIDAAIVAIRALARGLGVPVPPVDQYP